MKSRRWVSGSSFYYSLYFCICLKIFMIKHVCQYVRPGAPISLRTLITLVSATCEILASFIFFSRLCHFFRCLTHLLISRKHLKTLIWLCSDHLNNPSVSTLNSLSLQWHFSSHQSMYVDTRPWLIDNRVLAPLIW